MGDNSTPGGIVLPAGVLATIEAQQPQPETPGQGGGAQILASALPGGVSAIPIDAATFLAVTFPACNNPAFSAATIDVTITARILNADGTLTYCAWQESFVAGAGLSFQSLMAPGYLISVTVTCTSTSIPTGVLFAIVGLNHQEGTGIVLDTLLVSNYVTSAGPIGWPGGIAQQITDGQGANFYGAGSVPLVNNPAQLVINSQVVQIHTVRCTLVTSAVVGNRYPRVTFFPATGGQYIAGMVSTPQTAGTSFSYIFSAGQQANNLTLDATIVSPLTSPTILGSGSIVQFFWDGLQAGDQAGILTVGAQSWL